MKQKNLLLVAVAVVCGLIAAFLTSQMSARSKKQQVEMVKVPQALVDLPIGTKMKAEELDKFVKIVEVPRDLAPVAFVEDVSTLKDKRVTRTMRANDTFNPADITTNEALNPPEGYSVMTARVSVDEAVAGFVRPGAKVDVLASVQMKKSQKRIIFPLFTDILILAIDSSAQGPEKSQSYGQLSMISFAVDKDTSLLLQAAITCNAQMRCALRHVDKPVVYDPMSYEEKWDILSGRIEENENKKEAGKEPDSPKVETVKVKVPTIDLAAGTEITEEFVEKNFTETEFPKGSVPENTAKDFDAAIRKGHYLLKDVAANHFVPKSFLGEKPAEPKPEPKETPKAVPAKKDYYEVTVNTVRGQVRHRYEKLPNGEFKYVGVVGEPTDDDEATKKQPDTKGGEKSPIQ
jgi:Flp pilus assembly protein CpaB